MINPTLESLRRTAVSRTLFTPVSLRQAVEQLGFVQADPIRAPARAQDLALRHRVDGYRAGDLERHYGSLDIEEGFFINYGFLPRRVHGLMFPRDRTGAWPKPGKRKADKVLAFVRERGRAHPREVDTHFAHGSVTNYWGGSSSATTHLLEHLHYRGLLRVVGREGGIRVYAPYACGPRAASVAERRARIDVLVDAAVHTYAPLPSATLAWLTNRLRFAVPQWEGELPRALARAKARLSHARVEGVDWYWPADEALTAEDPGDTVRLLAPFDPLVWDRRRFTRFWGWEYRFEAYTPAPKRKFGYYALPLLWREQVIGWANVAASNGTMVPAFGYVSGRPPRERAFTHALEEEVSRLRVFLAVGSRGEDSASGRVSR